MLTIFVPAAESPATRLIRPGSAIVGGAQKAPDGMIAIDYEGNVYDSEHFSIYAERVLHAAGRHVEHYPTVARMWAKLSELVVIGEWNENTGEVQLLGPEEEQLLADWLGVESLAPEQLRSQATRYQMKREIDQAMASGDPAMRFAAQRMARQLPESMRPAGL